MLLSIVFSFRNEQEVLPELIERVGKTLNPLNIIYELIFVNDASTDGSLELLMSYRDRDKRIKIINMSRSFGVTPCIMAGLRHSKGDVVVYMDADLQDPPELIPGLLEKFKEGFEVVNTIRTKRRGENAIKTVLTRLAYRIIAASAEIDIPQDSGDFKLLSRRAVEQVTRLNEYDPYMRGLVRWIGFKQTQVFYERQPRFAGRTHFSLIRNLNPLKEFIRGLTSFSQIPLYFMLILGLLMFLPALIYLLITILSRGFSGLHNSALPAIITCMFFLTGIILLANGVLGAYIGRLSQDIKNRPPYIIESKIGIEEENV